MADQPRDQASEPIFEELRQLTELLEQNGQILRACREVADARREVQDTWCAEDDAKLNVLREGLHELALADRQSRRRVAERQEAAAGKKEAILQELDRGRRAATEAMTSFGQEHRREKERRHRELLDAIRESRQK